MYKANLFVALVMLASAPAAAQEASEANDLIFLDLTKTTNPLTFNADNGAWTETYNTAIQSVDAQVFNFTKWGFEAYGMWWGFTPSNSTDNTRKEDTVKYQYSNMAKGGIELDAETGLVKTDEFGDPTVSAEVPYLIGYYADFMSEHPCELTFAEGAAYEPVGVYVNLTSYTYYTVVDGDAYARSFRNGDKLTLRIIGVPTDGADQAVTLSETGSDPKSVDILLASAQNGDITAARGWKYVDLTSLGTVKGLYFEVYTTDMGQWGANTPLYFALDKLSVKSKPVNSRAEVDAETTDIVYDRATSLLTASDFVIVTNAAGQTVSSGVGSLDLTNLTPGVYVARTSASTLKFLR